MKDLAVIGLSRMAYDGALRIQRDIADQRIKRTINQDVLLLVEHPPTITLGRGASQRHLIASDEQLAARQVVVRDVDRGGDITFHGPGQIVAYPIFDLQTHTPDLHVFLRQLEMCIIHTLEACGISGQPREGLTGVWVEERKIASIGIHVKKWVTWHGLALNVTTDLSFFDLIVPCGITNVQMTTMQRELGVRATRDLWSQALDYIVMGFSETFHRNPQMVQLQDLGNFATTNS